MHRGSSNLILPKRVLSKLVLNRVLVALAVVGFAGVLLTGCDRTISDDGSWLPTLIH